MLLCRESGRQQRHICCSTTCSCTDCGNRANDACYRTKPVCLKTLQHLPRQHAYWVVLGQVSSKAHDLPVVHLCKALRDAQPHLSCGTLRCACKQGSQGNFWGAVGLLLPLVGLGHMSAGLQTAVLESAGSSMLLVSSVCCCQAGDSTGLIGKSCFDTVRAVCAFLPQMQRQRPPASRFTPAAAHLLCRCKRLGILAGLLGFAMALLHCWGPSTPR